MMKKLLVLGLLKTWSIAQFFKENSYLDQKQIFIYVLPYISVDHAGFIYVFINQHYTS